MRHVNAALPARRRPGTVFMPLALALLAAACSGHSPAPAGGAASRPAVAVRPDQAFPVALGHPAGAVLWLHPQEPSGNRVIAAAGDAGLLSYGSDGRVRDGFGAGASDFVAIAYGFDAGTGPAALLVAQDRAAAALRAYAVDPRRGLVRELTRAPLPLAAELSGLCLYRSTLTGRFYAFAATDEGELQQWELAAAAGAVSGRIVRRIPVGKGAAACTVDDVLGQLYLADESTGLWRIGAEPESDTTRELIELVAPRGTLGEAVGAVALVRSGGAAYLLAADAGAPDVHVLALPQARPVGRFAMAGVAPAKVTSIWALGSGTLLIGDEGGNAPAFRQVRWDAVAQALGLPAPEPMDPRRVLAASARTTEPTVETQPVDDFGDAADDPAIWVHPRDPSRSLIIGAQKKRGVAVNELSGKRLQVLADGRTNNVDLRQDVLLGGRRRDVVAGTNRETRAVALYEVDAARRRLVPAAESIPTGFRDPYGVCMYHSAKTGRLYVFANNSDAGEFRQWEISASGPKFAAKLVREFTVGSQAEGCVADDATGALYIAEEDVGLWRYGAEPQAGTERRQIDTTAGGNLTADVEGIGIFQGKDGAGWIVVSNQGADNFAVYRREGDNAFVGHFSIVANNALGIDGAAETDGLEVTSRPLGRAFPQGMLVVQDGRNLSPAERQNYKLVPWEQVAAALGLR